MHGTIKMYCIRGVIFIRSKSTHTHTPTQTDIGCVHMCIVHHTSTLNDKLCINLNLLTFILNVLILILLINTHFFHFGYLLFKETSTKW